MHNWYLYFVQYWLGIGASCGDIPGHVSVFWKGTPKFKKGRIKRSRVVNGKKSLSWLEVVTVELGDGKKTKQKAVCGACARSFPFYKTSTLCRVGKCWPCTCHFMQWPTDCSSSVIMQGKLLAKENGAWKAGKCVWHAGVMSTNDGKQPGVSLVFAWGLLKRCTSPQHSTYEQSELAPPNQFFFLSMPRAIEVALQHSSRLSQRSFRLPSQSTCAYRHSFHLLFLFGTCTYCKVLAMQHQDWSPCLRRC